MGVWKQPTAQDSDDAGIAHLSMGPYWGVDKDLHTAAGETVDVDARIRAWEVAVAALASASLATWQAGNLHRSPTVAPYDASMRDLAETLKVECDAVASVASRLGEHEFGTQTACAPWDIKALPAHMWRDLFRIPKALEGPEPLTANVDAIGYWTAYDPRGDAPSIATHAMETAAEYDTGAQVLAAFQELVVECYSLASQCGPERRIELWWGPHMRLDEFLKTRILEIVVHCVDLTDALQERPVATTHGLVVTVTILDGLLAEKRPTELAWSDIDFIRKGTGREPLTDGEGAVLGPVSARFPLLG
jgi:hypothetical protein